MSIIKLWIRLGFRGLMVLKLAHSIVFCVITAVLSSISMFSCAEENIETLIFYDNFPPFSYLEEGQVKGLFVDVVTAVFDDMGTAYKTKSYPFKRALLSASKGDGFVVGILKNEERQKYLDFSSSFYIEKSMLFVNKGYAFPFRSVSDLKGKIIGLKLGWSYGEIFDQARGAKLFTSVIGEEKQLYILLNTGRLDAVIGNELSAPDMIKRMNLHASIEALPTPLLITGLRIATQKGTKERLIEKFNIHMNKVKVSGAYEQVLIKYEQP